MSDPVTDVLPKESKAPEYLAFLTAQIQNSPVHTRSTGRKLKMSVIAPQLPVIQETPEKLSGLKSRLPKLTSGVSKLTTGVPKLPVIGDPRKSALDSLVSRIPKLASVELKLPVIGDPRKQPALVSRIPKLADVVPKGIKPSQVLGATLKKVKSEPKTTKPAQGLGASLRKVKSDLMGSILPSKKSAVKFSKPKSLKNLRSDAQMKGSVLPTRMSTAQFRRVPMHLPQVTLVAL